MAISSLAGLLIATGEAAASTGDRVERDVTRRVAAQVQERDGRAQALIKAESGAPDLVVGGSRGLRGLKSLGNVSERVAHKASCSVRVVRLSAPG